MRKITLAIKILLTYRNSFNFFLERLGLLNKTEVIYTTWNGFRYACRVGTTDFAILNEVIIFGEYFNNDWQNLNPDSTVFDFGAQAGSFSVYTSWKKGCKVVSFEPDKENISRINKNAELNNVQSKITIIGKAVTNSNDGVKFHVNPNDNKGVHSAHYQGKITIDIDSIDILELMNNGENIDFLKMDIEGGENELLVERNNKFFKTVNSIVLEYHNMPHVNNARSPKELMNYLESVGFKTSNVGSEAIGIIEGKRN